MSVQKKTSIYFTIELSLREISFVVYVHALMTRKSCAVGMRNAILGNHLKSLLSKDSNTNFYCEHFGNSTIFGFSGTLERLNVPIAAISKVPESLAEWKEPKGVHVTGHVVLAGKKGFRSCALMCEPHLF